MPSLPNWFKGKPKPEPVIIPEDSAAPAEPVVIPHKLDITEPQTFAIMRDLQEAGFKVLDRQSGREFHAFVNLPAYGLTRKTAPTTNNNAPRRGFGFLNEQTTAQPEPAVFDILINKNEAPYDIEAVLYLDGTATWSLKAEFKKEWIAVVADAVDVPAMASSLEFLVNKYDIDLIVIPLLESFEKGVRIKPSSTKNDEPPSLPGAVSHKTLPENRRG